MYHVRNESPRLPAFAFHAGDEVVLGADEYGLRGRVSEAHRPNVLVSGRDGSVIVAFDADHYTPGTARPVPAADLWLHPAPRHLVRAREFRLVTDTDSLSSRRQ